MAELAAACPGCDIQHVRALVRNARREQALGSAPKSARELFQVLKAALPEAAAAGSAPGYAAGSSEAGTPR
jgi:ribosome-associated protein